MLPILFLSLVCWLLFLTFKLPSKIPEHKIMIYLAASVSKEKRESMLEAAKILRDKGYDVWVPIEHPLPHSYLLPNRTWGKLTFDNDIKAIDECDFMVQINYGREGTTAGTTFEQGYAYKAGKKILLVEMTNDEQSLMCANGTHATVKGLEGLKNYDFETAPILNVDTIQK